MNASSSNEHLSSFVKNIQSKGIFYLCGKTGNFGNSLILGAMTSQLPEKFWLTVRGIPLITSRMPLMFKISARNV